VSEILVTKLRINNHGNRAHGQKGETGDEPCGRVWRKQQHRRARRQPGFEQPCGETLSGVYDLNKGPGFHIAFVQSDHGRFLAMDGQFAHECL
jgi:hypothetical protein